MSAEPSNRDTAILAFEVAAQAAENWPAKLEKYSLPWYQKIRVRTAKLIAAEIRKCKAEYERDTA